MAIAIGIIAFLQVVIVTQNWVNAKAILLSHEAMDDKLDKLLMYADDNLNIALSESEG